MIALRGNWVWVLAVALPACGCRSTKAPEGTGALECARQYHEALVQQDWSEGYAVLHPDSRARCSAEQFARLAAQYRRRLGFEPHGVRVRSCEEHGVEAIAHVVFTGRPASQHRSYKDAIVLRKSSEGWGVDLPPSFGEARSR